MKKMMSTILFLGSISAFAMPSVGDKATYKVKMGELEFTSTTELVSFDASSNTFMQKSSTEIMGQTEEEVSSVSMDDLMTDESAEMLLNLCETDMVKGKLETVTVSAGSFNACTVSSEEGSQSIAKVPFGLVKGQFVNGGNGFEIELMSFSNGSL
jgi:hypothetical protein